MDKEPMELTDSDQPQYQLRNRTTTVPSSSSQVTTTSHANLPAIVGCMAEGRSEEVAADASQWGSLPREMLQLSPVMEVDRDSQRTSSVISDTPLTTQPDASHWISQSSSSKIHLPARRTNGWKINWKTLTLNQPFHPSIRDEWGEKSTEGHVLDS